MSLQQAADYAGEMIRTRIGIIQDCRVQLPSFNELLKSGHHDSSESNYDIDKDVKVYIQSLEYWIIGHIYWSFATKRYFGSKHREVERSLVVKLKEFIG